MHLHYSNIIIIFVIFLNKIMSERKLAHIEKIEWVRPIEGADRIVTYGVLGWEVVDQKDKYQVGEKVVYCEIDSLLPEKPEFEFLRDRKFRVRTIKLKKQVSQGLILHIDSLLKYGMSQDDCYPGLDVTGILGITKYLSPSEQSELQQQEEKIKLEKNKLKKFMMRYSWFRKLFLSKKQKSGFPYWVSKTDEERIQNIPYVLEQFKDKEVYVTEKIDYQSGTWTGKMVSNTTPLIGKYLPKKFKFIVCSRNLTTNDRGSLYWKIADKYKIEAVLRENPTLTIQGEQGDTKIQGNKYKIKEPTMWVFNIIDHEKNYHFNYFEMTNFCQKWGLDHVQLLGTGPLSEIGTTVDEIIEYSKGKSLLADIPREGVVIRCIEGGKKLLSFKAINPDFLLKYAD